MTVEEEICKIIQDTFRCQCLSKVLGHCLCVDRICKLIEKKLAEKETTK